MRLPELNRRWAALAAKAAGLAVVALALVVGLGQGDDGASAATTAVNVGQRSDLSPGNEFNLSTNSILAGDTVHWQWFDGTHNVTPFNTTETWGTSITYFDGAAPDTWDVTFNTPGTVWYFCTLHAARSDIDTNGDAVVNGSDSPNFGKMIGRINVAAPPPDTTPPTTSAVAAAPNPTNGASAVTLTATVADTGTPLSNIAAAEYFTDAVGANGAGAAMNAADGSFNATSENVTASVSVSGLALGGHTLFVHGRDAAGNWGATASVALNVTAPPAGAETASISIAGGSLALGTNPIDFGAIALTGIDQTVDTAPAPPWWATDARGTGSGWNITISSTDFSETGGGLITVDNFKMQLLGASIVTVSGNAPPTSQVTSYQPLGGAAAKLLSAGAGTGMGTYDFTPDARLIVPAETVPGDYQAFMTVSINSGP